MSNTRSSVRRAVMELVALLSELRVLVEQGDRQRYFADLHYRWVIHRLWIAVGNEVQYLDPQFRNVKPWRELRILRNQLAHVRLPDIEDDQVWRVTTLRPSELMARLARMPA